MKVYDDTFVTDEQIEPVCDRQFLMNWLSSYDSDSKSKVRSERMWTNICHSISNDSSELNTKTALKNQFRVLFAKLFPKKFLPVTGALGLSLGVAAFFISTNFSNQERLSLQQSGVLDQGIAPNEINKNEINSLYLESPIRIIDNRPRVFTSNNYFRGGVPEQIFASLDEEPSFNLPQGLIDARILLNTNNRNLLLASNESSRNSDLPKEKPQDNSLCASLNLPEDCLSEFDASNGRK